MKKIIIEGKFTAKANNFVIVDIFRTNSSIEPYNSSKTFHGNFREEITDLQPNLSYEIDFSGYTIGTFDLTISGDFKGTNPITKSYTAQSFNVGINITTNP